MPQEQRKTQSRILSLSDFSAGIIQNTGVQGALANSPAGLGAASITNTYRCVSLPGGGLGPLPKKVSDLTFTDRTTSALPAGVTARVTGFCIFGPMYKGSGGGSFSWPYISSSTPFEVHLAYEYVDGANQLHRWRKYPYYSADASVVVKARTQTATNHYAPTYFVVMRMNPTDPTISGYPVIVGSWMSPNDPAVANTDYTIIYPDPTSAVTVATDTPYDLGANYWGIGIPHQSRYVSLSRFAYVHGANSGISPINEYIFYTAPNDYTADGANVTFGDEVPSGYGAWGSLTSSDLLLIKHRGGAYLVQGDLNTPIIRRMPSVVGTGGIECLGTSTMYGFVYCAKDDGVYAWQGGDGSVLLSPQLEGGFWDTGSDTLPLAGGFISWGNWVLTPNNFLYDGKGWWRLEDPATAVYYLFDKDPINNTVYCAKKTFSDVAPIYASGYDPATPASDFSWQSQPIGLDPRRRSRIRSVSIVAQGAGTVTVTITPTDGDTVINQPAAMDVSTTGPQRVRLPCDVQATEFVVRIVSAHTSTGAAPVVYSVDLEVEEGTGMTPR